MLNTIIFLNCVTPLIPVTVSKFLYVFRTEFADKFSVFNMIET